MTSQPLAAQLRAKRAEMMTAEVEAAALRLFEERGFDQVTVDEIAAEARISVRTFYRYFPAKEDVLLLKIDRGNETLRAALAARPADEPALRSLRRAVEESVSREDARLTRQWTAVVAATPVVTRTVLGAIQLKTQRTIAEFLGSRLGLAGDAMVPTMLAAAAGGVIQAARIQWFVGGGDLVARISEGLEILERGIGAEPATWSQAGGDATGPS
ncbi:TetR family transcriptional regulator [Frankia sp. CNm7]|uniref:TetR family transcriptional regulator n=1 Tax=Frankia nepalensis TaxID=1836974 RepID=A0A937UNP9_9ACTN|nr:TetR family transcriptional regulator [Frankia nepalensis]MBL7494775.1 TetR family transcriptional regulator [Frankia nepalensis]MBL7514060.1 TetR family transcriptional regulator [Frankia nepalensis]MBL7518503.1 TetR family transcriptional regulator [Frankia nepalensis]MBL7626475.1 TetR family transcriptional regulator [Frankia nepalensis]